MRPEEYRSIIRRLEMHYQEFLRNSQTSEMFGEEDKKAMQGHFDKAQQHYDTLIIQLPNYRKHNLAYSELSDNFPFIVDQLMTFGLIMEQITI